jgi:hypothetical protein
MIFENRKTDKPNKYNRNIYREVPKKVIEIDWSHYSSTPSCRDDAALRRVIRSQIKPFCPAPQTTPLATIGKMSPHGVAQWATQSTPLADVMDTVSKTSPLVDVMDTVSKTSPLDKSAPLGHIGNYRHIIDFQAASLTESAKRHHICVMLDMVHKLASCWNTLVYDVNEASLLALFAHYNWQCPVSGKYHTWRYPLTIEFLTPVWLGGKIQLSNMRPRYTGWLPGEYNWLSKPTLSEMVA